MAVTKIWAIHDNVSRVVQYCDNPDKTKLSDLEQVLRYAANDEKTLDEGENRYAVTGINCNVETAAQEMAAVQKRFGKTGGNVAYHAYQSFKPGEVTAEECHQIGVETARRLWGQDHQVLVATHYNTGTFHNHFVVNSVGMWDGKKLDAKFKVYYALREISDQICRAHGLSVVQNPQRHKAARSVYFAEKNGEPTRYNLMRDALDKALTMSCSWRELSTVLRKMGYVFQCSPTHKYATIRSLSSQKSARTFRLGAEYDKNRILEKLLNNQRNLKATERYRDFMRPYSRLSVKNHPPTQQHARSRNFYRKAPHAVGYLSLFRCIAVVLGLEPLYETQYQKPLSAECREACRKLERITDEITLVAQEHLDTPQDVQNFITKTDEEMDEISAVRNKIRNQQRHCTDPVQQAELKQHCAACTTALAQLRKKQNTAHHIIKDNPQLRELLVCERDAQIENDPYLSEREKQSIRGQATLQRKESDFER